MAFAAMTVSAATAADYMKVSFNGEEVENGGKVKVTGFATEGVTMGLFGYDSHDNYVIVENVSAESYDLSWKSEYANPTWAVVSADPKKYGQFTLCTAVVNGMGGNCFNPDPTTGAIDKVHNNFESKTKIELQDHLTWGSGAMVGDKWMTFEYTDADKEAAKNELIEITITLCPMAGGQKVEGAEFVCTLQFGDDNNAVAGIENDIDTPAEYYTLQGVRVANPEKGIYIKRQGSKAVKVIL